MSDRLPNAIDRHVASRLHLRRLEAGMTQTQLAQAVGVTFQQLQKYEGATNRISAGALYQLALTLDVPVQYFFDGLRGATRSAYSYLICGAADAARSRQLRGARRRPVLNHRTERLHFCSDARPSLGVESPVEG
jgi:transcriptional regulator with XRE-family HTH domain